MAISGKVFIFDDKETVSPDSASDLEELLRSEGIFPFRPDIVRGTFDFNLNGLIAPTFVVPGGFALWMGYRLSPFFTKVNEELDGHYNYVGVCAGGFIGTKVAKLFHTSHKMSPMGYLEQPQHLNMNSSKLTLNVVESYESIGSFYPTNIYQSVTDRKKYMPYRVTLATTDSPQRFSQLYVAGPGFMPTPLQDGSNVLANYADNNHYSFDMQGIEQTIEHLPAIIQRRPDNSKGGVLLSGTHIEASVKNSRFFSFFKSSGNQHAQLNEGDVNTIESEQDQTRAMVVRMLKDTVTPRLG